VRPVKTHNLRAVLDVSIRCRIMPMENLLNGLVNGADPRKEPPYALLVHFDRYGPDTDS